VARGASVPPARRGALAGGCETAIEEPARDGPDCESTSTRAPGTRTSRGWRSTVQLSWTCSDARPRCPRPPSSRSGERVAVTTVCAAGSSTPASAASWPRCSRAQHKRRREGTSARTFLFLQDTSGEASTKDLPGSGNAGIQPQDSPGISVDIHYQSYPPDVSAELTHFAVPASPWAARSSSWRGTRAPWRAPTC
jgi:hypothetical protein